MPHNSNCLASQSCKDREIRAQRRSDRKEVRQILQSQTPVESENVNNVVLVTELGNTSERSCSCNDRIAEVSAELESVRVENHDLKRQIKDLQDQLSVANAEIIKLKGNVRVFEGTFSKCQQQALLKGRCSSWSSEDIAKAVTLRSISYKALCFIRDVNNYPLPSEVTIKRRLRQFSISPGLIELSLNILK